VDTVVKRCRGREIDKKRVATEIYDAGNARQRDDDVKRTKLFVFFIFFIGAACAGTSLFLFFF
jgi:hypothetical protein